MSPQLDPLFVPCYGEDPEIKIIPDLDFGNFNPETDVMIYGGIKTMLLTQRYKIFWPEIQGAQYYRLYGSLSPMRKKNILEDRIAKNETHFIPPVFTPVIEYYFWVTVILADGSEHYLDEKPSSLQTQAFAKAFGENPLSLSEAIPDSEGLNEEMGRDIAFIRDANLFELENGGEPGHLFQRRFGEDRPFGIPCECTGQNTSTANPGYQGRGNCALCFGTGIYGGYYPSLPIRFRYSNMPVQNYTKTKAGYQISHEFNSAMIWAPQLRDGDLIVRDYDGTRFIVSKRQESSFRTVRLHQAFDLEQIAISNIKMDVTDEAIARGLQVATLPGFTRSGFMAFG